MLLGSLTALLWTIHDFYVTEKGTLAPWDPPSKLVIVGLYKFTRNPMYLAVLGFVFGYGLLAGSPLLIGYGSALVLGFHLRIMISEEPALLRKLPAEWAQYTRTTNRWLPRISA